MTDLGSPGLAASIDQSTAREPDEMIPLAISRLIVRLVSTVEPLPNDLPAETARRHGAIPLMGDIGGAWLLRPDGSVWEVFWDSEEVLRPIDPAKRSVALAVGAKRYPWLSALLPTPDASAVPCAACRGEGQVRFSADLNKGGVICSDCQALGWRAG